MFTSRITAAALVAPVAIALIALAACGQKTPPTSTDPTVQAEIDKDAELKAREEELARKEADLALKEREQDLARRESDLARQASRPAAPRPAAPRPAATPAPVETVAATPPKPAGPRQYTIPAGTSLSVQLPATITTKTARVGDRIAGNLTSDVVVDGKVVAKAGALVQGSVTEVISGSNKIGGRPTLGLSFDSLTMADGGDMPVSARITQLSEKSDTGRDTAKIAGGAVAGAVLGHQIDSDRGKIIGALIGAAAGTAAAKNTGTEVELPAGTVLGVTLNSPVTVTM